MRPRHGLAFVLPWSVSSCALVVGFPDRELALEAGTDARGTDVASDRSDGRADATDATRDATGKPDASRDAPADTRTLDAGMREADAPPAHDGGHDSSRPDGPVDASASKDAALRYCLEAVSVPGPDAGLGRIFCDDFEEGSASLGGQWDSVANVSLTAAGAYAGHSAYADIPPDGSINPTMLRSFDGGTTGSTQTIEVDFQARDIDAPQENSLLLTITVGGSLLWVFNGFGGSSLQLQEYSNATKATGRLPTAYWQNAMGSWVHVRVRLSIVSGGTSSADVWVAPATSPYHLPLLSAWVPGSPQVQLGLGVTAFGQGPAATEDRVLYDNVEVFESN